LKRSQTLKLEEKRRQNVQKKTKKKKDVNPLSKLNL